MIALIEPWRVRDGKRACKISGFSILDGLDPMTLEEGGGPTHSSTTKDGRFLKKPEKTAIILIFISMAV